MRSRALIVQDYAFSKLAVTYSLAKLQPGLASWRAGRCNSDPVAKNGLVDTNVGPDFLDQFLRNLS